MCLLRAVIEILTKNYDFYLINRRMVKSTEIFPALRANHLATLIAQYFAPYTDIRWQITNSGSTNIEVPTYRQLRWQV